MNMITFTDLYPLLLSYAITSFWIILKILTLVIPLIIGIAYLTFFERKVIAYMQLRVGPNMVGPFGLLQPFADGIKLLHKEIIIPLASNKFLFILAPILTFSLSLMAWAVIPMGPNFVIANLNVGVLYIFALSSLGVYGIIIAGWASQSKYAFLGAIRSAAQMISYELSIGTILASILLCSGSLNLSDIIMSQKNHWYIFPLFPLWVIFFISCLAETNRSPFDLPEAEAELVAGYNVEYSSMTFALFFLGEYANMILMSALNAILFFGGWLPPMDLPLFTIIPGFMWMILKISFFLFIFLWVRASLPRYRYDQLMRLGWKVFLPFSLLFFVLQASCMMYFDWLP